MKSFVKTRPVTAAKGQTDGPSGRRMDLKKLTVTFRNFCERAKNYARRS